MRRSILWELFGLAVYVIFVAALLYAKLPRNTPQLAAGTVLAATSASYAERPGMPSLRDISSSVNVIRSAQGLSVLPVSGELTAVAQQRADDMAARTYFAHLNPDGKYFYHALQAAGIDYSYTCENLALESVLMADRYVNAWMTSTTGHRECMLRAGTTSAGYGVARITYGTADTSDDSFAVVAIYVQR